MCLPKDHDHLVYHIRRIFTVAVVAVTYDDEIIHLDIDGARFSFEIGSDDDAYVFNGSGGSFVIPLMDPVNGAPPTPRTL